jgi:hypothetical protein
MGAPGCGSGEDAVGGFSIESQVWQFLELVASRQTNGKTPYI